MIRPTERYAVGLYRVSTAEQGHSGLGLEAQQASVRAFVAAQGWTLVAEFSDIASGKDDRRPGFQAALTRCRQLGAVLAADMPGADDLMMRIYAAMAQKERELISERTKAALSAAKARGTRLGGDRGYRPTAGPDRVAAAVSRRGAAERAAHRLLLQVDRLRSAGATTMHGLARALTEFGIPAPRGGEIWTHTTVGRLLARTEIDPTRT